MTTGADESGQESGGALRQKLEESISTGNEWKQLAIAEAISKYPAVKPEDLGEVAPGELDAKASQLQQQRDQEAQGLVKQTLKQRGLSDDQITALLAGESGEQTTSSSTPNPLDSIRGEQAPPRTPNPAAGDELVGEDRIRAALLAKKKG